jgi:peptidoglycan L-alanyl-D-glutamate endopeptidase CwlK
MGIHQARASPVNLSARSIKNLTGVHADLVSIVTLAAQRTPIPFEVIEGLRTVERQKQLVAAGASKTMNSRHITGHAVDLAPTVEGQVRWDWPLYRLLSPAIKQAAQDLGKPLIWGGDWKTFKDGPHFELDRRQYP